MAYGLWLLVSSFVARGSVPAAAIAEIDSSGRVRLVCGTTSTAPGELGAPGIPRTRSIRSIRRIRRTKSRGQPLSTESGTGGVANSGDPSPEEVVRLVFLSGSASGRMMFLN